MADAYRDYANTDAHVRRFYRLNHERQTLEFARAKRAHYGALNTTRMGIWEACETLDSLVDEAPKVVQDRDHRDGRRRALRAR